MGDKNSRQLKAFHSALVSASPDDLDPNVIQGWIDNPASLVRTIRKALAPDETATTPLYVVAVNYDLSLAAMIRVGQYDWVNSDITSEHFSVKGKGTKEVALELVHFDRYIESEEAIRELNRRGLRPATIEELLAFGAKYPKVQRGFPVVALGSVWRRLPGFSSVPCLWGDSVGRSLGLSWFEGRWDGDYRVLAVRK